MTLIKTTCDECGRKSMRWFQRGSKLVCTICAEKMPKVEIEAALRVEPRVFNNTKYSTAGNFHAEQRYYRKFKNVWRRYSMQTGPIIKL